MGGEVGTFKKNVEKQKRLKLIALSRVYLENCETFLMKSDFFREKNKTVFVLSLRMASIKCT